MKEEGSELLDSFEPEELRNLPESFQKLLRMWERVRDRQKRES